jgi:glycosyltransferase involved in cell wall biosynthesis
LIDVLLPFYGDPSLLRLAVHSVLEQDTAGWRLVVVDDSYPDRAAADWLLALERADVSYVRNQQTLGVNGNFRRALSLATAEHVVFLGCDDLLGPGYIGAMRRAIAQHPTAAVVSPGVEVIDGEGRTSEPLVDRVKRHLRPRADLPATLSGEDALVSLLTGNWTYFPSLCWRRDLITAIDFRPGYGVVLDLALLTDVLLAGGDLLVIADRVFKYRRHPASESSAKTALGARFEEEHHYFDAMAAELERRGMRRAARAARAHLTSRLHATALLPVTARRRDRAAVARLLRHAIR